MTTTSTSGDNGVNLAHLLGARGAVTETPDLGQLRSGGLLPPG